MPGFGHRYHTKDPRYGAAFRTGAEAGVDGEHMQAARAVEKAFATAKKALPINVDGAIGAILADLGMNLAAFNGIFMIARTPGLVAHVIEEQTRENQCDGSIRSITATMDRRPEIFPLVVLVNSSPTNSRALLARIPFIREHTKSKLLIPRVNGQFHSR